MRIARRKSLIFLRAKKKTRPFDLRVLTGTPAKERVMASAKSLREPGSLTLNARGWGGATNPSAALWGQALGLCDPFFRTVCPFED